MSTRHAIAKALIFKAMIATSLALSVASIMLTAETHRLLDAKQSTPVGVSYGYATHTRDGSGSCIFDGLRDQVAPGSRGRELTPDEEAAFIKALEKIGADTAFVKRKGVKP